MNTPDMVASESKAIDEKIKSISVNYLQLMLDCAKDETLREKFLKSPGPYLNERVGMKIPESVKVIPDTKKLQWPVI